jgi:Tfp pilus assembly protein PilF
MRRRIKEPGPLARSLNNFGTVLVRMGKPAEAEPSCESAWTSPRGSGRIVIAKPNTAMSR